MVTITTEKYRDKTQSETRVIVKKNLSKIKGNTYLNKSKRIKIKIELRSELKLAYGGKMYPAKAALTEKIPDIIRDMIYVNFGDRKVTDKDNVVGFLNFKCAVKVDKENKTLKIAVCLKTNGDFVYSIYYSHDLNLK